MTDEPRPPIEEALRLAKERLTTHDFAGAIAALTVLLDADPRNIQALVLRAQARAPGDLPGAMEDYERAVAVEPASATGWYYRGLANEILGRTKLAREDYRRAKGLAAPHDPDRAEIERKAGTGRPALKERLKAAPMTWILVAVNVAVMACFPKLLHQPEVSDLLAAGALERFQVWSGQYWRMVTAMFLHIGVLHLFMNMAALVQLCTLVELRLGKWKMLAAFLLTGIAGNAASLLGHHVVAAGASGALFGIEGVVLYALRDRLGGWKAFFQDPGVRKILKGTGVWLIIGATVLNMDNYAHVGGWLFGFVLGWLFIGVPQRGPGFRRLAWAGSLGLLVAACVGAAVPRESFRSARLYEQGRQAFRAGKLEEAERLIDESLAAGPSDPEAYLLLRGSIRRSRNDPDGAMKDYETILRLHPSSSAGHWGRGAILTLRKDYAAAVSEYNKAILEDSKNPDLLMARALALRSLGDRTAARSDLERALLLAPRDWEDRAAAEKLLSELH